MISSPLLALLSVLAATVYGASNEDGVRSLAVSSFVSASSDLMVTLDENKLILHCVTILVVIALVYSLPPGSMAQQQLAMLAPPALPAEHPEEAAGRAHAAQGDHASAVRSYTLAAEHHKAAAETPSDPRHSWNAVGHYVKAAAMYAAAGKQERMHLKSILAVFTAVGEHPQASFVGLTGDYTGLGKYDEQRAMHESAAHWYDASATECAAAGRSEQGFAMKRAAAEQYEASAKCAAASHHHCSAAAAYSIAADRYRAIGDLIKTEAMKEAEGQQHEAEAAAVDRLGHSGRAGAALYFQRAARAYKAVGNAGKALAMREAAMRQTGDSAAPSAVQDEAESVVGLDHEASDSDETRDE